jgi:hypothetical protein
MKNIILVFFCIAIFSCTKTDEKKEIPREEPKEEVFVTPVFVKDTLVFTVQIAALRNPNAKLASLANIYMYTEDDLLKYRFGSFKTYAEAKTYKIDLRIKHQGAFVQAMLNESPISIKEALQY